MSQTPTTPSGDNDRAHISRLASRPHHYDRDGFSPTVGFVGIGPRWLGGSELLRR